MSVLDFVGSVAPGVRFGGLVPVVTSCVLLATIYRCRRQILLHFVARKPTSREVTWGKIAIPEGERWSMLMSDGRARTLEGPVVVHCWGETMFCLERFSASHSEYVWVQFLDGRTEIKPGPSAVFKDPAVHQKVQVLPGTKLGDNEVLVVYRPTAAKEERSDVPGSEKVVSRHLVKGPCLYVPSTATEWHHEFSWTGSFSNAPDGEGKKIRGAAKFKTLQICPRQTYFDVDNVRTRDDALVTVKVMIFYRMVDIEVMLKETHDPPGDFVNALSSDVIEWASSKSFEEFKKSTEQLNDLSVYKQLTGGATRIGFDVTKVVFRGYGAPARLQKMHDDAIERRTKLTIDKESEEQEQSVQDMKLEREEQRIRRRRQIEVEGKTHELEMKRAVKTHELELQRSAQSHELEMQRAKHEAKQREQTEDRRAHLEHLASLKRELGLSGDKLAEYMLAEKQGPPSKVIQFAGMDSSRAGVIQLQEAC